MTGKQQQVRGLIEPGALAAQFEKSVFDDLESCVAAYRRNYENVLSPFYARDLCAAYKQSPETMVLYAGALAPALRRFLSAVWESVLTDPATPLDKPAVVFIGAGAGSGLTTLFENPSESLRARPFCTTPRRST